MKIVHSSEEDRWRYNLVDCVRTREIGERLTEIVAAYGLEKVDAFQQAMFWPVLRCMQRGIAVDRRRRDELAGSLLEEISAREATLARILGHPLNPRSPVQMAKLFYEDLRQPKILTRAKKGVPGHVTCDDEALKKIALREPILRPLVRIISELRSLGVFLSSFVLSPLDVDGRMRTSYNICGTETFRLSSSENAFGSGGNLQNIPKGGEDDEGGLRLPNVRGMYVPDPEHTIFDTDLSKADLRIVTWEADETEMKAMLREGRDPYIETAREYYHDPSITKTREDGSEHPKYRIFKSFAHGCVTAGHEVLTPEGWVPVELLGGGEEIAVWSKDDRSIRFEVPAGINRDFTNPGESLVSFEGQAYSQEVTADHRMPYTTDSGFKVCRADEVPVSSRLPVSGYFSGSEGNEIASMRLLAAFQADGTFDYKYATRWHFRKERKIERLLGILQQLQLAPKVTLCQDGTTQIRTYWRPPEYMKVPGAWLLQLSGEELDAWLDELQYWDGHVGETGAVHIATTSREAAEWIQTVAHLRGKGSRINLTKAADGNRQALWRVSLNNRQYAQTSSLRVTNVKSSVAIPVYCPKTTTGFFLVRRNGHISITGNTHYLGTPSGLAGRLGLTVHEVDRAQTWYFGRYPRIKKWQGKFCAELVGRRYVQNVFGFRRYFFGRIEESTMREAIAWLPQSTVAIYINHIWLAIHRQFPHIEILLQVHDSLVGEFPSVRKAECLTQIAAAAHIELPYDDPLVIPVGIKTSDVSWGACS